MSGTLFTSAPRRDSLQPPHVATSNEPQGGRSAPPPPSEGAWLCDKDYKCPIKSSKDPLEMYNEILERHDEKTYRQLKEEINFLMVVAGLFLAIVAAFTIESYKFLQEDKQDIMSDLLVEVVRLLNDTSAQGKAQLPKPFTPKHHAIVVNQLWFLSMILSLIAVAMGTFCLQWISALSRGSDLTAKHIPPRVSLTLRQLRHEGLDGWGVRYAPEALLFIVQLSIGLFICGLVYFLWNVSERTAIPTLVMTGIAAASLCLINLLPFLQPLVGEFLPATLNVSQCPYKSPTSWFIYNAGTLLLSILSWFLSLLPHDWVVSFRWVNHRSSCFTGFDWKTYDEDMQYSRIDVRSKLSYFESGLISALDRFPYDGEAKDIISSYLKSLVHSIDDAQQWETFSQQSLSSDEKRLIDEGDQDLSHRFSPHTVGLQRERLNRTRIDFLSALILQHLTNGHERFASQSLHRRVELYIRVKNSTKSILSRDGSPLDFGQSLVCPFEYNAEGIDELDLGEDIYSSSPGGRSISARYIELKFQFLRCVRHLIDIRRFNYYDIRSAAMIVRRESAASMTLSQNIQNLPDNQRMDPPAEEEHTVPLLNQSSPRNVPIGNISNLPDPGTTSSPPNDLETGGPESATHNTSVEDRTSFESLCLEMRERLSQLTPSHFEDRFYYYLIQDILGHPDEPEPENVRTEIVIDVPQDHEGT